MIRLFTIRAVIATLKRVIAISRKLKPRTWACIAVTQVIFAALCFWEYNQQSHQHYVKYREEHVTQGYNIGDSIFDSDTYISTKMDSKAKALIMLIDKSDDKQFLVRQHDRDFLNREPDTSGLIFWNDLSLSRNSDVSDIDFNSLAIRHDLLHFSTHGWISRNSDVSEVDFNSLAMRHDLLHFSAHGWNTEKHLELTSTCLDGQKFYVESDKARSTKLVIGRANRPENRRIQSGAKAAARMRWMGAAYFTGNSPYLLSLAQQKKLTITLEFPLKRRGAIALPKAVQTTEGGTKLPAIGRRYKSSHIMRDWFYRRLPQFQPTFVSPSSTSGSMSLLDMLQKLALLFQAIILSIGSAFASAFGVVSYLRGKADLKLKQLQIRELEIKLENLERERDRALQEAARTRIILLS